MAEEPHGCLSWLPAIVSFKWQLVVTCGKGTQCCGNCCSTTKRTCSSDLFHEHIGSHLWLVSEMTQVTLWLSDAGESGLYWDEEGLCFRLSDKPELFIGYVFMLHLVTFAASKLFVSSGPQHRVSQQMLLKLTLASGAYEKGSYCQHKTCTKNTFWTN